MTAIPDFPAWREAAPGGVFTDWLRARCAADWSAATGHRFVDELAAGSLADAHFRCYLVQDYVFIETLVSVIGFTLARAPDMASKKRWAGFLGVLTSEENDYFQRAFDALGVPRAEREQAAPSVTTTRLRDAMMAAADAGAYADLLAVVVPAEWVYLSWAQARREALPPQNHYREWIGLHVLPEFEAFVAWIRAELDAVGPSLDPRHQARVARRFEELVELEVAFFDHAYTG